jgi:hypothetical protein
MSIPTIDSPILSDESFLLRKLIVKYADNVVDNHRWIWESDRWKELVFAIISRSTGTSEREARMITEKLNMLDLVGLRTLSRAHDARLRSDDSKTLERIVDFLEEHGASPEQSESAAIALSEAAKYFQLNFDGRVQSMFRRFGQQMVEELRAGMGFSTLSNADAEYVLIYWLQNVLNLPLSLKDDAVNEFASNHSTSIDKLIASADEMGINLAVLDDLIDFARKLDKVSQEAKTNGNPE